MKIPHSLDGHDAIEILLMAYKMGSFGIPQYGALQKDDYRVGQPLPPGS
jgi:hypothetical protein